MLYPPLIGCPGDTVVDVDVDDDGGGGGGGDDDDGGRGLSKTSLTVLPGLTSVPTAGLVELTRFS
jgi:hypothetical protein